MKERYPRFLDTLNDLDDALSLINLFSNLPKHDLLKINPETVQLCQRLIREFYLYCSIAQNFKKGFISIKGVYLNVEIMGQDITWLSPINQPQKLSFEIDYEIMLNFLELYTTLMSQVNLKLFKDIGMEYPPPEENVDLPFFGLNSVQVKGLQDNITKRDKPTNDELLDSEEMKRILQKDNENKTLKTLFKDCVFYISREVPVEIFGLIIQSGGGLYGDESEFSEINQDDPRITHYIVDRPSEFITFVENKEYIQPQWAMDCINNRRLLPVSEYAPGKKLPPHLSPFYEYADGEYKPTKEINVNVELPEENEETELNEMLLSKNKKKLLQKIREEKAKKIKTKAK